MDHRRVVSLSLILSLGTWEVVDSSVAESEVGTVLDQVVTPLRKKDNV